MPEPIAARLLRTPHCIHADPTAERLRDVANLLRFDLTLTDVVVDDEERARELDFPGSPTVRIGDHDIAAPDDDLETPVFGCRTYGTPGVPPRWMVESAMIREHPPEHILFLCVANSARSQLADGLAADIAERLDRDVTISSAGSKPSSVRENAIASLEAIDVETSELESTGISAIDTASVDLVITLCSDEVCPSILRSARKLHWPLPDPANGTTGEGDGDRDVFDAVRDELHKRLRHLMSGPYADSG